MSNNIYAIDFGTCNFKVFSKSSGKIVTEKNTIAVINKNQIYAYGDDAYAMYEKAPETINVMFPVATGVIADYNFLQTMIFDYIEHKLKGKTKNAEYLVAVPTDITDVESVRSSSCSLKANIVQRMYCFVRNHLLTQLD